MGNTEIVIFWDWNDQKSIKKAEKLKNNLENKGYALIRSNTNSITEKASLTYKAPKP